MALTQGSLKSDIQFVQKISQSCGDWLNTSFVQTDKGCNLKEPLKAVQETCERTLAALFQRYGEMVFKNGSES